MYRAAYKDEKHEPNMIYTFVTLQRLVLAHMAGHGGEVPKQVRKLASEALDPSVCAVLGISCENLLECLSFNCQGLKRDAKIS
jgi:hypothetical protein